MYCAFKIRNTNIKHRTMRITLTLLLFMATFSILKAGEHDTQNASVSYVTSSLESTIGWHYMDVELGEVVVNEGVPTAFKFTNLGEVPVIIKNVNSACGCAVMDYDRKPVMPGETREIKAVYTAKADGYFSKVIVVNTNIEGAEREVLRLTGTANYPSAEAPSTAGF